MASRDSGQRYLKFLRAGEAEHHDGFFSARLSHDQLLMASGIRLHKAKNSVTMVSKATEEKVIVLEEDSYSSGQDAITRAMARFVTEIAGMPVTSPVSAHSRMLKGVGGSASGYVDHAQGGGSAVERETIELSLDDSGELTLGDQGVEADIRYILPFGVTYSVLDDFLSRLQSSGVASTAVVGGLTPRTFSRLTGTYPANFTLEVSDDKIVFGRVMPVTGTVAGPEDEELLETILCALRTLDRPYHTVMHVIDAALSEHQSDYVERANFANPLRAGLRPVPYAPVEEDYPMYRELNCRELEFVGVLASWGVQTIDSTFYKNLSMDFIFGKILRGNGRNVKKCLSDKIKAWRAGVDLSKMAVEDTARIIAKILCSDVITQKGDAVAEPIMAALVLMCKDTHTYHLNNGLARLGDGKHYPL